MVKKTDKISFNHSLKLAVITLISLIFCFGFFKHRILRDRNRGEDLQEDCSLTPTLMPWQSIGGCGAGGGGGGSDAIKWVGEGVSGGLVEVEVLPKYHFGRNFHFLIIDPRFSFKPTWKTGIGIRVPFASKTAEVQYRKNQAATTITTGGMGDLSFDISRIVGSEGQFSLIFGLTLPTGQYDIKRGVEEYFVPNNLQMGSGVYIADLGFNYSRDVENGLWLFDASFRYPFNMKPFSKENEFLDEYFSDYKSDTHNDRFYYRLKHYGENDLGDYIPPGMSGGFTYAYRGVQNYVHSFGLTFSAPFGVAWIHSERSDVYDPRPDPDHEAWRAALVYGLEFSRPKYPVFIAVAMPIHDKSPKNIDPDKEYDPEPMENWNAPDWEDFLQQWTVAVGIKSAMF